MELDTGIGRFPACFCGQIFGHICLRATGSAGIEQAAGLVTHQVGRLDLDIGFGYGELNTLVLADRTAENFPFTHVVGHLVGEPVAVADAFGRNQRALGVEAGEDVFETLAFLADEVFFRDFQIDEEQLVGFVVDHVQDRANLHARFHGLPDIDEEDRQAFRFLLHLGKRRRARQEDHQVGMLHTADPDLLAVDHITVALLHGGGLDPGGVRAGGRFGHAHGLQPQFATGDLRQKCPPLFLRAVPHEGVHVVHLAVTCTGIAARTVDFLHDDGGFRQAEARTAIFFRNQRRHPAFARQSVDKFFRVGSSLIDLSVIFSRKLGTKRTDTVANILIAVGLAGHVGFSSGVSGDRS